jgi:hypothetical protein
MNLPPEIRYKKANLLCLGTIPGPKQPYGFESFLHPMLNELRRLKEGIRAWDGYSQEWFTLTASILQVVGDQPAVASLMRMKGPQGKFPCRICTLSGVLFR